MYPTSHSLLRRHVRGLSLLLAALAALAQLLAGLPVPLAHASSLSVTGTADIIANDGVCTLREAIINANRDDQSGSTDCAPGNGADEIAIPAGTYTLSITGRDEDAAVTGDLDLTQSVTIVGAGSASTIIQAGTDFASSIDRVFQVLSGVSAEFRDVTIGRGNASISDNGGGIYNAGTTTIKTSTLSNNYALAGGGIYNDSGGTLTISSSTLANNSALAGGGISNSGTLTLSSSTLSNNHVSAFGGGVYNVGMAAISSSTLSSNSTSADDGGGIYNDSGGTLTIGSSTLSNNNAGAYDGGGIYNAGTVTISSSTLSNNDASAGGGISNSGTLTISSSTLSNNNAGAFGRGGGISNSGTLTLSSSTLWNNLASSGGGIYNDAGRTAQAKDSIIAKNFSGGNCNNLGTLSVSGTNLSTDNSCLNFTQVTLVQLNLGPLQDNGGPTHTHALLPGSVAIDAAADCTDAIGAPITEDQRGVARPQGAACDIGAFEASPPAFTSGAPAIGTYGGGYSHTFSTSSSPVPTFSVVGGSLPPGLSLDGATGVLSGTPTQAGNFSFVVRASNSDGNADQNVDLTINKAPLTIVADNKSKVYGAPIPTLTASYSGLVNGDTPASLDTPLTLTTDATATSPAGTYPIVTSGAADANYTITFVNGTLTVSASPLFQVYLPQVGLGALTVSGPNPPQVRRQVAADLRVRPLHLSK